MWDIKYIFISGHYDLWLESLTFSKSFEKFLHLTMSPKVQSFFFQGIMMKKPRDAVALNFTSVWDLRVESNADWTGFAILRSVIGQENMHYLLVQSNAFLGSQGAWVRLYSLAEIFFLSSVWWEVWFLDFGITWTLDRNLNALYQAPFFLSC